jgi:hypothetical protein
MARSLTPMRTQAEFPAKHLEMMTVRRLFNEVQTTSFLDLELADHHLSAHSHRALWIR